MTLCRNIAAIAFCLSAALFPLRAVAAEPDDTRIEVTDGVRVIDKDVNNNNTVTTVTIIIPAGDNVVNAGSFNAGAGAAVEPGIGAIRAFADPAATLNPVPATGASAGTLGDLALTWHSGAAVYTYEVKADGNGRYGLYAKSVDTLTPAEQRNSLLAAWNSNAQAGGHADELINASFAAAVTDGCAAATGAAYGSLSAEGKFNAGQLASVLATGAAQAAGYDALMLYNGGNLTMANEAAINLNRRLLSRAGNRSGVIRREVIVDEILSESGGRRSEDDVRYGPPNATRVWADAVYHSDVAGARHGFAGYEYDGLGVIVGADRRAGNFWYGGALAYVDGDYADSSALSSGSSIETYAGMLYAGAQAENGLYVSGTLGYSYSDTSLRDTRSLNGAIGVAAGDFYTDSILAAIEGGMDFRIGDYVIVTPSAGLRHVSADAEAHTQRFGGAQTVMAGEIAGSSLSVPINLAVSIDVLGDGDSLLSITGNVGYAYELRNDGAEGRIRYAGLPGIGSVDAASRAPGRHAVNFGLAARYLYNNLEFGLGYDFVHRDAYNAHMLTISAGVNF